MRVKLNKKLELSKVATGLWRQNEWNYSVDELYHLLEGNLKKGITTIDTADIYGGFKNEEELGKVFVKYPNFRDEFEIVTKAGIIFPSEYGDNFGITIGQYNHNFDYFVNQAKRSIKLMHCNYIDLLLVHRPSPLTNYAELAKALHYLVENKLVKHVGVSNFLPAHFDALQSKLDKYDIKLATNQIEMSAICLEHFKNGNIEYFQQYDVVPMIWSPVGGGEIFSNPEKYGKVIAELETVTTKYHLNGIDEAMYAWLNTHPVEMCIVCGSGKAERYDAAINGSKIKLTNDEWFRIYVAAQGYNMP